MDSILLELLQPSVLLPWMLGMAFGVFVGSTPGLTATMAVALIVPVSYYLDTTTGIALILGVSFTAIFAGDIPAIHLRIPGTPASTAGTLDGYALARQGRGQFALLLDLFCSSAGGMIGVLLLILIAPALARFALRFSHYEYFWISVAGLSMSAIVSRGNTRRGFLAAALGMLLSAVGIDVVSGTPRFTFGSSNLMGGLDFIPIMIGLFGLSAVWHNLRRPPPEGVVSELGGAGASPGHALGRMWRHKLTVLKSSVLGTFVGVLPGAGADIAAWASYGVAQRTSKEPEKFGHGAEEGVIAPSSANNAAVGGAWIPSLVFGIPGDSVTAIALGALLMKDIRPGPLLFEEQAAQMNTFFAIALITQFLLLPAGWLGIKVFGSMMRLPRNVVLTAVMVFSVVGAFAIRNALFDIWLMVGAGVLGYFLEKHRVPLAPLVLGLILGPKIEENLRTGLIKSGGELAPFFTRPICLALILLLVIAAIAPPLLAWWRSKAPKARRP
jgi:putative tricarboxylic transport membrane protein